MEKTDKETHDFMNVESFSQLPFIRPSSHKEKSIRLFGKDFGAADSGTEDSESTNSTTAAATQEDLSKEANDQNSRKFECHYCCRNFPTSQALGGHQNAHKRERQHAKRAHFQSTMVNGSTFSDAQMYGLMNYHRFPVPPPLINYHHHTTNSTSYNHQRFYGNNYSSHQTVPINGSPLGLWRYPNAQNTTYNSDQLINVSPMMSTNAARIATSSSYVYDSKAGVQDQVSLDLHL